MSVGKAAEDAESVARRLVGDYELVSFVRFQEGGAGSDADYIGWLRYDEHGNMAGMGMPRDLPLQARDTTERVTGGFAYWGTVSIDVENARVIHHVVGSPGAAQWVGQDNVRYYQFDGDLLHLSVRNAEGRTTGTLTWRRLK